MKKVSQSILFWCLLGAFVPCVISATLPPNSDGEKKFNAELQKKDPCVHNRSLEDSLENRDTGPRTSQNSDQPSGRMKRGCNLLTCSVHDLAYRINQLSNKTNNAPHAKSVPVATAGDGGVPSSDVPPFQPMGRALSPLCKPRDVTRLKN